MMQTLTALAEPSRFRIVELLRGGPRPVNDIAERLELAQPQVSKHLRVLKEVGLVGVEQRAQQRVYELRASPLKELSQWVDGFRELWEARFDEMDQLLEELVEKDRNRKETGHE